VQRQKCRRAERPDSRQGNRKMKEALQLVDAEKDERINIKSLFPLEKMRQNAADWGQQYVNNEPFPRIGIDDFLTNALFATSWLNIPVNMMQSGTERFSTLVRMRSRSFHLIAMKTLPVVIQHFISALNSRAFVTFLEQLTGIDGLIPDPYLTGGGLHMIPRGGRLAMQKLR
jgi:hypothetical protein